MRVFNLSRLCRPRQFQQLAGQELVVKVLCNSLALNKIFPTYIFSGQRGLGKTTSARIFAAALLCEQLDKLLSARTSAIPCLECSSCQLLASNKHPDFIEIDAASNTGIDNIREVQESALLMPVRSKYKVYLIDEVHMLSRAAFNAFLKMLEEPPSTTVFLMATTELHKVPETIRSRSLQLLFWPASNETMVEFLSKAVQQNSVKVSPEALKLVASLSCGSFRDALNKLEQLSLLDIDDASEQMLACRELFGVVDLKGSVNLLNAFLKRDKSLLLEFIKDFCSEDIIATNVFEQLLSVLSDCVKCKIAPQISDNLDVLVVKFTNECSFDQLNTWTKFFWNNEEFFYASKNKALLLKTIILQLFNGPTGSAASTGSTNQALPQKEDFMAQGQGSNLDSGIGLRPNLDHKDVTNELGLQQGTQAITSSIKSNSKPEPDKQVKKHKPIEQVDLELVGQTVDLLTTASPSTQDNETDQLWAQILESKAIASDKLLVSILKQAKNVSQVNQTLVLKFSSGGSFFKNKIDLCQEIILAEAARSFQNVKFLEAQMGSGPIAEVKAKPATARAACKTTEPLQSGAPVVISDSNNNSGANTKVSKKLTRLTNMNEKQWPKSSLMVDLFDSPVESE